MNRSFCRISGLSTIGSPRSYRYFSAISDSELNYHLERLREKLSVPITGLHGRRPKAIFVLGGPGAGKGTQSEKLSKEYGLPHLSAGELLRNERSSGSQNGYLIDTYLKEGKIVPVELSLSLLKQEIEKNNKYSRFIIDGFPRNSDNLDGWMRYMYSSCDIEMIIFIECQESKLEARLLNRGLTSNRNDDNILTIKKRFVTFHTETLPVIQYFREHRNMFPLITVNGDCSIEEVYLQLKKTIDPILEKDSINLRNKS